MGPILLGHVYLWDRNIFMVGIFVCLYIVFGTGVVYIVYWW